MPTEAGYSNIKKQGRTAHKTLHTLGSSRIGQHVVTKSLVERQALPVAITAVAQNESETLIRITIVGHTALVGDIARFYTGALQGAELEIVTVVDANNFVVRNVVGVPAIADTLKVMYYVTPKSDAEGNVNFSPGPTTFSQDAVVVTVAEDTANPANNKGLPVNIVFYKDGVPVTVNVDSVTPANNRLLPVELSSLAGPITVNAGDLSVSIVSTNDSTAIGDGVTGDLAKVDLNDDLSTYALKVKDNDANTKLTAIIADTLALSATTGQAGGAIATDGISVHGSDGTLNTKLKTNAAGQLEVVGISSALPTGASTLAEQQAQTTLINEISQDTGILIASVGTDGAAKPAAITVMGGVDGSANAQELRTDADGHLQIDVLSNVLPTGAATEATLAALNAKVVNDFGAAPAAVRVAAQLGNPTGGADFAAGSDGAQTLRVSANLKRSGNELSYNNNIPDANTLRVSAQIAVNGLVPDIGTGTAGPNTLRTVAILHDNDGDPIPFSNVLAASQWDQLFNTQCVPTTGVMLGWTGTTHREIRIDSNGRIETSPNSATGTPSQAKITVGTSAVRATVSGSAPNAARKKLYIKPTIGNAGAIYFGSSSVTTANGMQIVGPDRLEFDGASDWYLISDTAAQSVEIVEVV